jgi:NAD(P)H-hydrate epimerase
MERAAQAFCTWFTARFSAQQPVYIACGLGNNGGDGLAIARLLHQAGYTVNLWLFAPKTGSGSADYRINLSRLDGLHISTQAIHSPTDFPTPVPQALIIDALLGSGLDRPLEGLMAELVHWINYLPNAVIAVDIPTGLFADQQTLGLSIQAQYTFSFERPKLSFFFPDNFHRVGEFYFETIGLDPRFEAEEDSDNYYVTEAMLYSFFKRREKFAHKGIFGHALLVMGSHGKMGAAILATKACLRAGAGLVTVHVPSCGYEVMQLAVPEAMVSLDEDDFIFTRVYDLHKYTTIALGCGLSTKNKTRNAVCYVLKNLVGPVVLDADALNILGQSPDWMEFIPKGSILTPHPKEFERMFGRTENGFERNELQRQKAQEWGVYIILKGANSCIATPEGKCYFNSTGNPGMGTAGSGDVLTGILAGLLAQDYSPLQACLLGVYLHGLAGDLAAVDKSQEALMAGDISDYLGKAFLHLQKRF